ncbi:AMP-dependent synthetase/ligase [Rhodococcus erythropolis]|uniref:AMP-dependent synthetase/ligase n=1 Tax=Rhodococcus erythropolis TaxID=1833 RepID=UPI001BE9F911|nr:long-chain fatty acid--CoA ligase [Rhodococcus erythropolis]MBT2265780.1 long-chain fatty acid--CoA ligase [Rhodococcus erythropolis]
MTEPRTLCEAFQSTAAARPDAVAIRTVDGTTELTWAQYAGRVRSIAAGLAALGIDAGDTLAIMLTNRPEFHLVDAAAMHLGATPFSIYNSNPPELIAHLLADAGCRILFCEKQFLVQVRAAVRDLSDTLTIIGVDTEDEDVLSLDQLEGRGVCDFEFDAAWRSVGPQDLATIIYTSGTTGSPKGVELTHANVIANYLGMTAVLSVGVDDRVISYLPDAHGANRWLAHWVPMLTGTEVTTVTRVKDVFDAVHSVRPTVFLGVPRTWYKIKDGIEATIAQANPHRRALSRWAISVGRNRARARLEGRPPGPALTTRYWIANTLVLSRIREQLGLDQMRYAVSSTAPIAPETLEFMLGLGLRICEAWGMSELTCGATINPPDSIRIGTAGKPLPGNEVRLGDDGELLVRSPSAMRGYRNDPDQTAEAIDADGWVHTGDIATIDADGYVRIVDRKKELIINSSGKNMSPANIENTVKTASPLIGAVAAIGDARPYVTALISLDDEALAAFVAQQGITDRTPAALAAHPTVLAEIEAAVTRANGRLPRVEQVRKHTVLPVLWQPGGDELTPTMKLRRRPIADKYRTEIDRLYAK